MSLEEVKALREKGNYDDARNLALQLLEKDDQTPNCY